eukprot:Opistho-1_new@15563
MAKGGWWMSSTRASPSWRNASSVSARAEICRSPRPFPSFAGEPGRPMAGDGRQGGADISVVIAGREADPVRRPEALQQDAGRAVFAGQPEIDQVTGHRHMVGSACGDIGQDPLQHRHPVMFGPTAPPVQIAGQALAGEFTPGRHGQRADMKIGQMGEAEHGSAVKGFCASLQRSTGAPRPAWFSLARPGGRNP